jgi:hypothetical protein
MPYSQQFWHRYEQLTTGNGQAAPQEWYSPPLGRVQQPGYRLGHPAGMTPVSSLRPVYSQPVYSQPSYAPAGYGDASGLPAVIPAETYSAPLIAPELP